MHHSVDIDIDSSLIYSEIEQDISDLIAAHLDDNQQQAIDADEVRDLIEGSREDFVEAHELEDFVSTTILDAELEDIKEKVIALLAHDMKRVARLERLVGTLVVGLQAFGDFAKEAHEIVNPAPEA
jgi:tyrosine-protein phosphatase YwqE